ncbi:thiolase family protein [Acidiferrimicrobium sp. IK]|uniref:thiolase family protein n=1 Tax=Acidiferrimicrobium sp. IK TaxID=2871700 RepID=UPI0021CB557A|nr:thiolase family protein [Acidiferrimicrobium sp. IK]MCU4186656.1 thiolase family protein [Acidiferrimicrobium sp. IK]
MTTPKAAVVGLGWSDFSRDSGVGPGTLIARACKAAIGDSGLTGDDIDGVVGVYGTDSPTLWPGYVVDALGLRHVRWWDTTQPPSVVALSSAAHAVMVGACDYVVCYHGKYRWSDTSVAGRNDPLRQPPAHEFDPNLSHALFEHAGSMLWAARVMRQHMDTFGSTKEDFGRIAVNNRTHAVTNPRAVFRKPITMDDYLAAPSIDAPMGLLDMDAPVDGAMAVVVTTEERARDLQHRPVTIEAMASSLPYRNDGLLWPEADGLAARQAVRELFSRTDLRAHDMDLAYPYDGFSVLAMLWLEALYTSEGEGHQLVRESWSEAEQRLRLFGRVLVCTHGGNLSEGRATQGFGHVLEAVDQLRGTAGARQVAGARTAVITNGMAGTNRSTVLVAD